MNMIGKLLLSGWMVFIWIVNADAQYASIVPNDSIDITWDLKQEIFTAAFPRTMSLGDTITIDSAVYRKVDMNSTLLGYLREDTVVGKAWFWGANDSAEYLIMDMSLNLGDTFKLKTTFNSTFDVPVIWIDTIGGRKRILFNYTIGTGFIGENFSFIEGVGPNASLVYSIDDPTPVYNAAPGPWGPNDYVFLVCNKYQDTNLVYAWDTVNFGCGQFVDIRETEKYPDIVRVSPNPSEGVVSIYSDPFNNRNKNFTVYDLTGRALKRFSLMSSVIKVDLSTYGKGVYLYRVSDGRSSDYGRIIIE
ncbi:MAG: T9SS type A sorting domain-containing protein [Flavobacteriales bacterium]|nr:T9SS type A sorting domain-containing protein [Flavobacteriales bacterium]